MARLVVSLVAVIAAAMMGAPSSAAAAPPTAFLIAYAYDGHPQAATTVDTTSERGPPAKVRTDITHDADVRGLLRCASARPPCPQSPPITTYDYATTPADAVRAMTATARHVWVVDGDLHAVPGASVAAKGAGEAGALVRYDAQAASRNLLGQVGEGYARTPSGYTVSAHAAERIVYGAPGRSPTTLGRVDDILNNPTRSVMRPDGSIRVFQGKDWVAVRGSGPIHIITVMVR